jgi:hypothetical protein
MRAPRVTRHTSIRYSSCCHTRVNMLTRVWQQLEYRIDVCRVTRGAHIEHRCHKKNVYSFLVAVNNSIKVSPLVFCYKCL